MNKIKCIIPSAGLGTRVGMKLNESKEMLSDPINPKKYIIDYTLDICNNFNYEPLVIVREEKKDLITYLDRCKIEYITIKIEGEWMESVLKSKNNWNINNLLMLPDTRWNIFSSLKDIEFGLELGNNAVIGVHKINDSNKWGIIKDYTLYEKPIHLEGKQWAWGCIGFKKDYGMKLFTSMKSKNGLVLENVSFTKLSNFKDITR